MRGDERSLGRLDHEHLQENKAMVEADSVAILEGRVGIKAGKDEPNEYRPQVPDHFKGVLLHGMHRVEIRPSETADECRARHRQLKQANIIARDAPIRWFNPDTKETQILDAD